MSKLIPIFCVEDYLEEKLNYDVMTIIMNFVYFFNFRKNNSFIIDQIKSICGEFDYLKWAYLNSRHITKPPDYIYMFLLIKNREKISTNYKYTKRDCIYTLTY